MKKWLYAVTALAAMCAPASAQVVSTKTGQTYTFSNADCDPNGRRLILAFGGTKGMRDRAQEAETLIDWAFREYENYTLIKAGEEIDKGKVWLGDRKVVPLIAGTDLVVTMKRASRREMKVVLEYDQPIPAPIAKGQKVASLRITAPGQDDIVTPLLAGDNMGRPGVLARVTAAVGYLLWGGSGRAAGG